MSIYGLSKISLLLFKSLQKIAGPKSLLKSYPAILMWALFDQCTPNLFTHQIDTRGGVLGIETWNIEVPMLCILNVGTVPTFCIF